MKDNSYVVIQAFMVNDLHLKGNELIVYATIYGFTQDGEHWFYGTRGYLAELVRCGECIHFQRCPMRKGDGSGYCWQARRREADHGE